ncbi:MAG: hypothetical protein A2W80_19475 [Candidatus Riflebacteria bacterium GWC2_50_8]|nr:MAG: hypothetical protein A2W80_19475 [Candidatus Riflebacteria bacterium GWC2_50_8]
MKRYKIMLFIVSLFFVAELALIPAVAANPFSEKNPLELSKNAATGAANTDDKQASLKSGSVVDRPCTLAVMADLHAKPASLPMLHKAIARVNALKDLYALAIVGDLCSQLGTPAEYEVLRRGLKAAEVPMYAVPGNHDILYQDNLVNGEKKRGSPAEKKHKQEVFKKTFNLKSLYYAKKAGGHLLVFLPNDTLQGIPCVLPSDDAFEFLRKTLRENRDLPTIIFCHAPLTGSYGDKKTMPPIQANVQPARKIQKILKENPQVYLWFSGHLHITPSQKYFNFPGNKVGGVTVIHVPPSQISNSWVQTVRLSRRGATVRTLDVRTGKYLKKHTRVFRPVVKGSSDGKKNEDDKNKGDDKNQAENKGLKKARIVVVNAHSGGNRNRPGFGDWLADQEPDIALVSESVDMRQHMRQAGRVYDAGSETRGRREVTVVVRDGLPVPTHDQGKISPDLGIGIAHDRWWTRVQTRVAGIKARVYSLHLNAVIQQSTGEPRAVDRWNVTHEGLVELEKQWRKDTKDGWAVIVGGDLNWNNSRKNANSHQMAPGRIFKRLGLTYVTNELMWLAWTPETHKSVKRVSMPPTSIPGLFAGEHPALRIDLQARKQADDNDPDPEESEHNISDEEAEDEESASPGDSVDPDDYEDPEEADETDAADEAASAEGSTDESDSSEAEEPASTEESEAGEDIDESASSGEPEESAGAESKDPDEEDKNSPGQQSANEQETTREMLAVVERLIEVLGQLLKGLWSGVVKMLPI